MVVRPAFRYFAAEALEPLLAQTDAPCECCGAKPGELHKGPFYAVDEVEFLCLDCIGSGSSQ